MIQAYRPSIECVNIYLPGDPTIFPGEFRLLFLSRFPTSEGSAVTDVRVQRMVAPCHLLPLACGPSSLWDKTTFYLLVKYPYPLTSHHVLCTSYIRDLGNAFLAASRKICDNSATGTARSAKPVLAGIPTRASTPALRYKSPQ